VIHGANMAKDCKENTQLYMSKPPGGRGEPRSVTPRVWRGGVQSPATTNISRERGGREGTDSILAPKGGEETALPAVVTQPNKRHGV
jgi:hypothetical protein